MTETKKTILIIDDHEAVRANLKRFFGSYNIIEADSKEDGLRKYDEHRKSIDLVITDCDMEQPEIGFDLISDIRTRGGKIPIIMLSGGNPEEKKARLATYSGDNVFVNKAMSVGIIPIVAEKLAGPGITGP